MRSPDESPVLLVERSERVALLTMSRPKALNALNSELRIALTRAWASLRDDAEVDVVVLTGVGRSFSVGRDLKETAEAYATDTEIGFEAAGAFGYVPDDFPKPVVAAVNGFCLGSGFRVALSCHLRFASRTASFGNPQVKVGRGTAMPLLLRQAGVPLAQVLDLVLTGESITPESALRAGIVSRIFDESTLLDGALEVAKAISSGSPIVRNGIMRAHAVGILNEPHATEDLYEAVAKVMGATADAREGAAAFASGQRPAFATPSTHARGHGG